MIKTPARLKIEADIELQGLMARMAQRARWRKGLAEDLGLKAVELRKVKPNASFKRQPEAAAEYTRNHYNRADKNAVFVTYANFSVTNNETGYEIFLKPETIVYVCEYTQ